ncbi:MAG: D-aminoacylase, partial [Bacteroidota bacterium]
ADLIVFDPHKLSANATYEQPHELATGIDAVWVNGKKVMQENEFIPEGNGRVIRAKFKLP